MGLESIERPAFEGTAEMRRTEGVFLDGGVSRMSGGAVWFGVGGLRVDMEI